MSYSIVRFFQSYPERNRVLRKGLTLEQAQAHCNNPETSSSTATSSEARRRTRTYGQWFDGYREE